MVKFTIGSDPEFMLVKSNKYYSAINIVMGTKDCRINHDGNEYYYDNVMAECAIKPSKTKEETVANFRKCLKHYANLVHPYKLITQASQMYTSEQLVHKDAREVGCKEEYCAYKLDRIKNKGAARYIKKTNFRSAGGHIHLGAKMLRDGFMQAFTIRMLDLFLGLPLIFIDKDSTAPARRQLYGQAGRHRKPAHGLEYRTPGNYWLSSPKLVGVIYDVCSFVLNFVDQERHYELWHIEDDVFERDDWANAHKCHGYNVKELRNAIDKSNYEVGKKFLVFIEKYLPKNLQDTINEAMNAEPCDLYKEWGL